MIEELRREQLTLLISPSENRDIYQVRVILKRLSGDDHSWHRMNRPFLTELRQQFLQWRTLSPQRMMAYVEESRRLFGNKKYERRDAETQRIHRENT